MLSLTIKNCNSIDSGTVSISKNALNIKYGINGTGKSTIAKAIQYKVSNSENLKLLMQFKNLGSDDVELLPQVEGLDEVKSIMIFDEDFINKFTFKKDEIIENSFDIFIKDEKFEEQSNRIEDFVKGIKKEIESNEELLVLTTDLRKLSDSFGKKPTKTGISKTSKFSKSFSSGNKLEHIPDDVIQYTSFLKSSVNTQWITWQEKGNSFLDIDECCPFCASKISEKKDGIRKVAETFEPKTFEHLVGILESVNVLGDYFNEDSKKIIIDITHNSTGITKEEELTLKQVKEQIDTLLTKIGDLSSLNHMSFSDGGKVIDKISALEINLTLFSHLNSPKTSAVTSGINESLTEVKEKVIALQKSVGQQKSHISTLINKYKNEINQFLEKAGYKYQVFFDNTNSVAMKLKHLDCDNQILDGKQHLSYGEKNAFAMLLFMYQCLSSKPDLIVLDDPISSFDKNKKYAIMRKLFVEKNSLKNLTVLMLTHDFEPIIDFFKIIPIDDKNKAHLIFNKGGEINESMISKDDVLTFIEVCDINIKREQHQLIKIIYLRRKLDAMNDKAQMYNLISNVIHGRIEPLYNDGEPMSDKDIEKATGELKHIIEDFDYKYCVDTVTNKKCMIDLYRNSSNDYEKLQIFRILTDKVDLNNKYLQKYINEVFHIENDNISQLDPNKYHLVPEFITQECDKYINSL